MRAPAERRSADEIATAIADEVGDPLVKVFAETLIDYLRIKGQPLTGNRKRNKQSAVRLRKQLEAAKKTVKAAPKELVSFIFDEGSGPLFIVGPGTPLELDPNARKSLAQEPEKSFIEELDRRIARCGHATAARIGKRANEKYPQQRAAIASRAIMERVGLPPTISETSEYCTVASLFFEAMTGKDEQDLRRACRAVRADKYKG
jgi:hypothetical protein